MPVDGEEGLIKLCEAKQYSIFINDVLSTSNDYITRIKSAIPNAKIINFEDDGDGAEKADLVFNALYAKSERPNEYAGERYYISNKCFLFYNPITISETVKTVFVSFGGADPQNYTDRVLSIISNKYYEKFHFITRKDAGLGSGMIFVRRNDIE